MKNVYRFAFATKTKLKKNFKGKTDKCDDDKRNTENSPSALCQAHVQNQDVFVRERRKIPELLR